TNELGFCPSTDLLVDVKAILAGPYDPASGLMRDDLRTLGLIPTASPYSDAPASIPSGVLSVSGSDAIVDWVLIELYSADDSSIVLHRRAALLQRDGDVVDVDGVRPVAFPDAEAGDYYVAVRHRNHLVVMTQNAVLLE
ncbi:MAG: hemagglutinin protein, partial [Bacteroidota bacterium]